MPRPSAPVIPRRPGGLFVTRYVTVWSCGRCRAVLARGSLRPNIAVCPVCGAHFVNGAGVESHEEAEPETATSDSSTTSGEASNESDDTGAASNKTGQAFWILGSVACAVIVFGMLGLGVLAFLVVRASSRATAKVNAKFARNKKGPRYSLDDEEEAPPPPGGPEHLR